MVPELSLPIVGVRQSFLVAMAEFRAEGRGGSDDDSMIANEMRAHATTWHTAAGFAAYVDNLRTQSREDYPRPAHFVPSTTWWYLDGNDYLGRVALRHRLNAKLSEIGGHIGYDVRPTARRRGYATAMLRGVLTYAAAMGIESALLTCDEDNIGSRKVIEACGGVYDDSRQGKRRYWVPTLRSR